MCTNLTPDDMRFARCDLVPVLKRRSPIGGPRHLEDAGRAFDTLHPQPGTEAESILQISDEIGDRSEEGRLLTWRKSVEVGTEPRQPGKRRHPPSGLVSLAEPGSLGTIAHGRQECLG